MEREKMDATTIGVVAVAAGTLAWPHVVKLYQWATTRKPVEITGAIESTGRVEGQSPGYHKWDVWELDALKYAVEKLPATTTLSEFVEAVKPGEDCRDSVVTLLSTTPSETPAAKGAKSK